MKAFISKNLKYPAEAAKHRIEGTVRLNYTINYKGEVIDAKVISGLGYGCDEEAIRVVKLLKYKVPKHFKMKVTFHKNINIHFRKPKQKPNPKQSTSTTQIQYSYVPSPAKKEPVEEKKKGGGYTITINY